MAIKRKEKQKISKNKMNAEEVKCSQYVSFSFRYLTTNNDHNFKGIKDKNKKNKMYEDLNERLQEISSDTYKYWTSQDKRRGMTTIPYSKLKFSWQGNPKFRDKLLTKDQPVYKFRFGNQDYRLLGIKIGSCSTFYIIGFDFNFSAYDHGS